MDYIIDDDVIFPNILTHDFSKHFGSFMSIGDDNRLISRCCRSDDWDRANFIDTLKEMKIYNPKTHIRKEWEFGFIAETLKQSGLLRTGKKGMGFAVGEELLPSYFAAKGIKILASDLALSGGGGIWAETGQNAGGNMNKIWKTELCSRELLDSNVTYRDIDMNHIPNDEQGYDFCWSVCAIEHVGTLELSVEFMKNSLAVLKPGGISIHTTEFNLSSNDETIDNGGTVLWRRRDVENLQKWMQDHGHKMEVSFDRGNQYPDRYVEMSPFRKDITNLICFYCQGYITTGFALIAQKGK